MSIIAVFAGMLVIGLLAVFRDQPAAAPASASVVAASAPAGVATDGFTFGRADAPVTIDVFEDFQCPACLRWGNTVFPRLAANEFAQRAGRLVFHGFAFIGPESEAAGRAAVGGRPPGPVLGYVGDPLCEPGSPRERRRLRSRSALRDGRRHRARCDAVRVPTSPPADAGRAVADGIAEASRLGVSGTPTLLVNGAPFSGSTYPELQAAVAAATPR